MESAVQKIAVICFVIIGLSHIFQPKAWARFFSQLCARGESGAFINGFMSLAFGALIVGFHNVWHGIPLLLTLMGWGQLIKAGRCFLYPRASLRMMAWVPEDKSRRFVVAGMVSVAIGGLLAYPLVME